MSRHQRGSRQMKKTNGFRINWCLCSPTPSRCRYEHAVRALTTIWIFPSNRQFGSFFFDQAICFPRVILSAVAPPVSPSFGGVGLSKSLQTAVSPFFMSARRSQKHPSRENRNQLVSCLTTFSGALNVAFLSFFLDIIFSHHFSLSLSSLFAMS